MDNHAAKNWFTTGGGNYARFRPEYPPRLATDLASLAPSKELAVDVGCGTGQLTSLLAPWFRTVVGVDSSADQLASASALPNVQYVGAPAENLPVGDNTAALITAAQAAHWFDLPAFYKEVRRIAAPGAILALISYGVMSLDDDLDGRFQAFYTQEIGPYWPAERKLVDDGYRTIDFPFEETTLAPINMEKHLTLSELLGYISTWSAVRIVKEAGREDILHTFAGDLSGLWGDPEGSRRVCWPINTRVGTI
ncbi:MAG TPA: class I SAM-dependent methyltransferase [Arthrobacter sp.]|nr:class I SAM-dependent methyltransferase [Arthrobacter sp.]